MRKATLQDLKLELWLRNRSTGTIYWTTKDGRDILINEMSNNHLVNTIKMLLRQEEEDQLMSEHIGDMDPMDYYDKY